MTIKSGVIGNDEYMDLFGKLNETSRVQRFEIGGIKIFFYWSTGNNLFSDCKRWLKAHVRYERWWNVSVISHNDKRCSVRQILALVNIRRTSFYVFSMLSKIY